MKKILTSILLAGALSCVYAQPIEPALKSLVDAEWSFINFAKDSTTRDAFWAQFTDETILFGEGPVNAKRAYEHQPANASWLKWEPTFSDIATSGDFGYNTGPWEYRVLKTDAQPLTFGHFVSVWRKQEDGVWKLALDIGIDHPKPQALAQWKTATRVTTPAALPAKETKTFLKELEQNFIDAQVKNKATAYKQSLSDEARLYRPGKEPMIDRNQIDNFLMNELSVTYQVIDSSIASTHDLGYVYGKAIVHLTPTQTKAANYLRIWKHETGEGWRIVLDLVTYK